jgi:hypothetical protein
MQLEKDQDQDNSLQVVAAFVTTFMLGCLVEAVVRSKTHIGS